MQSEKTRNDFDQNFALLISFSGWLVLLVYLACLYFHSNQDLISLVLSSGESTRAQYSLLILFAPLLSSILGYAVNRRILQYRDRYLKANQFKDMAEGELVEIINSLIVGFVNALDAKSHWTKGHSLRVKHYCMMLADELELDAENKEFLEIGAMLHDIGKIGTYDDILNKIEDLTEQEFAQIKKHPGHAVQILMPIKKFHPILNIIKYHHERIDGFGYPDGLTGKYIPFLAKILCVADAYDAITSRRPYKNHMSKSEAIQEIQRKVGSQFDPKVVEALVKVCRMPDFDVVVNESLDEGESSGMTGSQAGLEVGKNLSNRSFARAVGSTIGGEGLAEADCEVTSIHIVDSK